MKQRIICSNNELENAKCEFCDKPATHWFENIYYTGGDAIVSQLFALCKKHNRRMYLKCFFNNIILRRHIIFWCTDGDCDIQIESKECPFCGCGLTKEQFEKLKKELDDRDWQIEARKDFYDDNCK